MNTGAYIAVMRPQQWIKNGFVLAALVFSQHLFEADFVLRAGVAFAAFCLISSATYIFNDIIDREKDSRHPEKSKRPLASGALSPGSAAILGIILASAGVALSLLLGKPFLATVAGYVLLQAAYNLILKKMVILDIIAVSLGFVIRAVAGAAAISVVISPWLILCTLLVALFLGFAKRRHEIVLLGDEAGEHRGILSEYSVPFLDQLIGIVTSATVVAYSIYTLSPEVAQKVGNSYMILTLPFVIYGIFRYLYLVHIKEMGGSPSRDLITDGPLLLSIFLFGVTAVLVIYVL
jgi:4-hydroxybenzoate polyprenyltransferase